MLPKLHFTIERWKYNPTFELWVSNLGHIRNKSKADIALCLFSSSVTHSKLDTALFLLLWSKWSIVNCSASGVGFQVSITTLCNNKYLLSEPYT